MIKLAMCVGLICIQLLGGSMCEVGLYNCLNKGEKIIIYENGKEEHLAKDSIKYGSVIEVLKDLLKSGREMPAFSVALDNDTREARKSGLWLEVVFSNTQEYGEMPFDSLLIEVKEDYTGFNINRGWQGKYQGRCYYINLVDSNMFNLKEVMINK